MVKIPFRSGWFDNVPLKSGLDYLGFPPRQILIGQNFVKNSFWAHEGSVRIPWGGWNWLEFHMEQAQLVRILSRVIGQFLQDLINQKSFGGRRTVKFLS